ncbi:OPY2 [Fusarium acutatum]|uniref:OPY2 n=1 Tax=Fusarium acutatum TaxID=78861 RepID=A0A8H4J8W3_9HYPO|nr:OPY2 [Fusarium acutatum]
MGWSRCISARVWDELSRVLELILQGNDAISCGNITGLQYPECSDSESCRYTVPLYCAQYATSTSKGDAEAESKKGGCGLTIGIIVGIIASLVIILAATYLVWRFYIKPKRSQSHKSIHVEDMDPMQGSEKDAASRRTSLLSTHTVHSMAPTILTRASNIIQIAYIPGVTNRAAPTSPNIVVSSVPLIPMRHTEGNRGHENNDQRSFIPCDLQGSIHSNLSRYY